MLSVAGLAALVLTQEPSGAGVVGAVVAVSVAVASAATLVFLRAAPVSRPPAARAMRAHALRRGVEAGVVVGLISALQVAGGLTPLTALFVVLAFAIMEYVLSAGRSASR